VAATFQRIDSAFILHADPEGIRSAVEVLRSGGLLALPTETVYGLGADASSPQAVARIFSVKGRPADHPLIVHIASAELLDEWAIDVSDNARRLADAFWPGPLTLIVRKAAHVSPAVTGGQDTVGIRVPDHPVAIEVLRLFGGGVAAPSANRFGKVSPTNAVHVVDDLGEFLDPTRDRILDGGACSVGVESTIVDCTSEVPRVLRPGGIAMEALAEVITGEVLLTPSAGPSDDSAEDKESVRAPGMLAAHYAPNARVEIVATSQVAEALAAGRLLDHASGGGPAGVLGPQSIELPDDVLRLDSPTDYTGESLAPVLYARLRDADRLGLHVLYVVRPEDAGLGRAVLDRLLRAATGSGGRSHS
jgi:L-threonylcarbamoyladenylate synthase